MDNSDFSKFDNIEGLNLKEKLSKVDEVVCDKLDSGGPFVGITYSKTSEDEKNLIRNKVIDEALRICNTFNIEPKNK